MLPRFAVQFDAKAGDPDWRRAVEGLEAALEALIQELRNPSPAREPVAVGGPVVRLSDARWNRRCRLTPLEEAAEDYWSASRVILRRWAPNPEQLRAQLRLAADMAGLQDPRGVEPSYAGHLTAENVLALAYENSLGLTVWEHRLSQRATQQRRRGRA